MEEAGRFGDVDELIAESRAFRAKLSRLPIVKVRYFSESTGEMSAKEYTYFSEDRLEVGDIVLVPVRDATGKARVSAVGVPESEITAFRDKVKTILAGSVMKERIPQAKPGDEWRDIKPLGPFTNTPDGEGIFHDVPSPGPYGVEAWRTDPLFDGVPFGEGVVATSSEVPMEAVVGVDPILGTAVVKIAPGKDVSVQSLLAEIMKVKEWADKLVVATQDDAKMATNDLSIMGKLKKAVEEKRKEYVGPLNAHVDAINGAFKLLTGPLGSADKTARDKVTAFMVEQQRRQREAEEINRQKEELARKEAALNHGEITVDTTPVEVPHTARLNRGEIGTSGLSANWTYEIIDPDALPREYMMPDDAMLKAVAKKHHDSKKVAGVRFYNSPTLRVSGR